MKPATDTTTQDLFFALRNLRHLYEQMLVPGRIVDQRSAADGLLAPAIRRIEEYLTPAAPLSAAKGER